MEASELRRAVAAAREAAVELGLQVGEVTVVHDSDRVALRLTPCDVLVRVASPGELADSAFEVEVARRLDGGATTGCPIGRTGGWRG